MKKIRNAVSFKPKLNILRLLGKTLHLQMYLQVIKNATLSNFFSQKCTAMTLSDRFAKFMKHKGLTERDLSNMLNLSIRTIHNYKQGHTKLSSDFLEVLLQRFPNLSARWLMKGEGAMLLGEGNAEVMEMSQIRVLSSAEAGRPGGAVFDGFADDETVWVPALYASAKAFKVEGLSMWPTVVEGDIVICQQVMDRTAIRQSALYVIVTKRDGVTLKRLSMDFVKRTASLKADNPDFQTFEMPLDDITGIWVVVAIFKGTY